MVNQGGTLSFDMSPMGCHLSSSGSFVRIRRLDANTDASVVLTMFDDDQELHKKVKEIYAVPTVGDSEACVEFETENDAARAVSKYHEKRFGWNRHKTSLERILPTDMKQCNHDSEWTERKEHDKKCRLSIFLREQKKEVTFTSQTVLVSGLNRSETVKHVKKLLGAQVSEKSYDFEGELVDAEDVWEYFYPVPGAGGEVFVRFHDGSARDKIQEYNGTYFMNETVYLKCVPNSEYRPNPKGPQKQQAKEIAQVHMKGPRQ
ncbi:hypothetical protein BU23DRAFT_604023 [Bimuria novae-zelandiae CBS 107.79]|uniref:RRM domain-containing protein n=1 Tax=Bimuria novae-zelandiae CBS 107.79 TaxID=1447943 RepID=A0A6A5ULW9_9PLEO|nr:hypothetical protein BU23DRAFT_604023 [Bimuria novae-zelandiae CBS 107.79]